MFIDYTATREVIGSGLDEIETDASRIDRETKPIGSESVSLSGAREFQLERIDYEWVVTTVPIAVADLPRWREFSSSVSNGELFLFDPFGTKAAPDDVKTVNLVRGSYKENRFSSLYMTFSFRVVER